METNNKNKASASNVNNNHTQEEPADNAETAAPNNLKHARSLKRSVTVVNQEELPEYSTERYFMLSELEVHAHSTQFLRDMRPHLENKDQNIPNYILFYILWKPDVEVETIHAELTKSVEQIQSLVSAVDSSACLEQSKEGDRQWQRQEVAQSQHIYIVVDKIAMKNSDKLEATCSSASESPTGTYYDIALTDAQELTRSVVMNPALRSKVEGIAVGVSNDVRAAPGLEACYEAVATVGVRERRRYGSPRNKKSDMGILCRIPDDLLGYDMEGQMKEELHETDAVDHVRQCRFVAEWGGQGNIMNFSRRAQDKWNERHGVRPIKTFGGGCSDLEEQQADQWRRLITLSLFVAALAYVWRTYDISGACSTFLFEK